MTEYQKCGDCRPKLVVRAREHKHEFGTQQIFECRSTGERWPK